MSNLVLYWGEPYQRKRAKSRVLDRWNRQLSDPEVYRFEGSRIDPGTFEQILSGSSLFSSTKVVLISRANEIENEELFSEIIEKHSFDNQAVLFESDSLEGKSSLKQLVSEIGQMENFPEPTRKNFPKLVVEILKNHQIELEDEAKKWFIQIMDLDLLRVEQEVKKLDLYKDTDRLSLKEVKEVVWVRGKDRTFDFFDALFNSEICKAVGLLEEMFSRKVDPRKIFFMLANETRRLIKISELVENGLSNERISSKTGIYKWLVRKKRKQVDNLSGKQLTEFLHRLHKEDLKIKRGQSDIERSLFDLIYSSFPCSVKPRSKH